MVFKEIDSKTEEINQLTRLLEQSNSPAQKNFIKADLTRVENGYKAEKENAYYLDFGFKDNKHNILLHDIRIEHNGQVAQIDHIIINRFGIEVLESKSFSGILSIKGDGSLDVKYGQKVKTFPNPIEQNNRHIELLKKFLKENMKLSSNHKLFGIPITSMVLINPKTTITNHKLPNSFSRADSFRTQRIKNIDKMGTIEVFKSLGGVMSFKRVEEIANFLIKSHKPKKFDYAKKYPMKQENKVPNNSKANKPIQAHIKESVLNNPNIIQNSKNTALCSKCKSPNIEIRYGKYGYYFKCLFCKGNTAISLKCTNKNCKPKLKKRKLNFYQVCEVCKKDELFFTNPPAMLKKK